MTAERDGRQGTPSPAGNPRRSGLIAFLAGIASVATVIAIMGITLALFLNSLWITFAQERAGVPAITGYTAEEVRTVTGSILADLIFGPPAFVIAADGEPVLGADERSHMVDVQGVLRDFASAVGIALLTLGVIGRIHRRSRWMWRAIARGSGALALLGLVGGAAALLLFDKAFLLFHLVFFPQGNSSFDPRTQRLTQLFPTQFWTETAIGLGIVGLTTAIAVTLIARRTGARLPG